MNVFDCVIIDSGVNLLHEKLSDQPTFGISIAFDSSGIPIVSQDFQDQLGHGTAVYSIIQKNAPNNTHIFNIKIFDKRETIDESLLIFALQYIAQNINCKVVNISLGLKLCDDIKGLYHACKALFDKDIVIVAAFDNQGSMSYPAAFDFVVGVDSASIFHKAHDYIYVEDSPVTILAKGGYQKVEWCSPEYAIVQGNSFSCAFMTANLLNLLKADQNIKSNDIFGLIKKNAKRIILNSEKREKDFQNYFQPSRALLFPFNKEMHALVNFQHLLAFEIMSIADIRLSGNVNRKLSNILPHYHLGELGETTINNIDTVDWRKSFDTVVVGHLEELSKLTKRDLLYEILQLCVKFKKNLICFDALEKYFDLCTHLVELGCKVYTPKSYSAKSLPNQFGKLYLINKPVVCVAGTSSCQGKFTLQLFLRDILLKKGYHVGQLGTEPSSLLFGMDEVFHYGYSIVDNPCYEQTVLTVNKLMHNIYTSNPDIIIAGIQSGTVPYVYDNIRYLTNHQMEVLTGIMPDVVILCINPYDDIPFIQRTIASIESYINTTVLCCVIYPMQFSEKFAVFEKKEPLKSAQLSELIQYLSSQLSVPIYSLSREDAEKIVIDIITYFSN